MGLLGRAHKQLFVNAGQDLSAWSRSHLDHAVRSYLSAYLKDPKSNVWHGVNVVALLSRAARGGLRRPAGTPHPRALAADLLASLEAKRDKGELSAWDNASGAEASLALGKSVEAVATWLVPYAQNPGADAFELASTLRQLEEVWQLDERTSPGDLLLPLLRGELLKREGGAAKLDPRAFGAKQGAAGPRFEKILGTEGVSTLRWYRTGERRCYSVARIDSPFRPEGTGFLVRGKDLADRLGDELLLATNAHVVLESQASGACHPDRAQALFFARAGETTPAAHSLEQVWSSPREQLDATLLRLSPKVAIKEPYPIATRMPPKGPPPERVYVIGHPGGRELSISLQDNELLDYDDRVIHYRAPTEHGSSGSPVFNAEWELIGLHHVGDSQMDKLDGNGTYPANEGISIAAIRRAL